VHNPKYEELAAAGFADRGLPDGRVLRICSDAGGTTVARIGRELGITRQGASKIVASLRDRRYVTVTPSATNGREKTVQLTSRATDYLAAHREAARRIEAGLRAELGPEVFNGVDRLLDVLGADDSIRMSTVLRRLDSGR